jgi:hypothetical protein
MSMILDHAIQRRGHDAICGRPLGSVASFGAFGMPGAARVWGW